MDIEAMVRHSLQIYIVYNKKLLENINIGIYESHHFTILEQSVRQDFSVIGTILIQHDSDRKFLVIYLVVLSNE